jgi:alcohol dehydrogenase/L-iditol 2-dehydrogenase
MMDALVNLAPEPGAVERRRVPVPGYGDDDVLLAVSAVAVCGSDLHQFQAKHSWRVNYPVVLGHEFCGVVAAAGSRVRSFAVGDRVVSETAAVIDAASPFVRSGDYHLDPGRLGFGYGVDGAMAGFVRVPERCLHRIPDGLAFEKAALTEPCCVAYNAACVNARIRPGDAVAVIGPGAIGLLCAQMARLAGACPLLMIGMPADARRLAIAERLGCRTVVDASGDAARAAVRGLGDGHGVDLVIDATGVSASLALAMELVRPGGQISKVGWGPQPCGFSLDPLVKKAVTLRGSYSHTWAMWEKVLGMLASGQLDPSPIISRVAPLVEWRSCFEGMDSGELVKAVLTP